MISCVRRGTAAAALLSAMTAGPAAIADPPGDPATTFTAPMAAEEALRTNPDLRAAYAAIDAARGRLLQAGLWPNPEAALGGRNDFAFQGEGERGISAEFAQRFPVAGRLARAKDVAQVDVEIALAEARDFERTLVGDVQRTVAGLVALDRALETRESVLRIAGELVRIAAQRFEAAEVSEAEVNSLEIELARFQQEKRLLELERRTEAIRLNRLLNRSPDRPAEVRGDLDQPLLASAAPADLLAAARTHRPDLERLRLESDRWRAEARLARAEAWEDWTLGGTYDSDRSVFRNEPVVDPIGIKHDSFLGLRLNVPLPLWNRNQGRVAEAQANESRARARLLALERSVEAEIETAAQRVAELQRVAREYRESLLPRVERNVSLLDRGYRQGLVSITALVQAEQQLADTALRNARTVGDLRQAEVDLETAAGVSPLLVSASRHEETKP